MAQGNHFDVIIIGTGAGGRPSVTLKNPQIPVPPTPSDRKVHTLCLGKTPLWPTPPRARKMTPERPFPALPIPY